MRSALDLPGAAVIAALLLGGCTTVNHSFPDHDSGPVWTAMVAVAEQPRYDDWKVLDNDVWVDEAERRIRIRDIADIRRGYVEPPQWEMRYNGRPAIGISVANKPGENIITLGQRLDRRLDELLADFPVGIEINRISWQGDLVAESINAFMISLLQAVVIVLVIPLNLLPYARRGQPRLRGAAWLYFFSIGVAFMAVEVVLIQRYTLFIGASVYSICTVLLVLLLAAGIGSRFAGSISGRTAFLGILAWLAVDLLLLGTLTRALAFLPMGLRVAVTGVLIAPLGFFMGIPFPKGGLRVGELIDWGFAVNGAASVLGATLIVLIAFAYGFSISSFMICMAFS